MNMKNAVLLTLISIFLFGCNPFLSKKDKYPEVPYLEDLINQNNVLEKIEFDSENSLIEFLKSDKILIKTWVNNYEGLQTIKIYNINKSLIFEKQFEGTTPLFFDKNGNIFVDNIKYYQPDYKRIEKFEIIYINKLITDFELATKKTIPKNDSISAAKSKIYAENFIKKNNIKIIDSTSAFGSPDYTHYPKIIQDSIIKYNQQLEIIYPSESAILYKKIKEYDRFLTKKFEIENLDRNFPKIHIKEKNNQLVFWSEEKYVNNYEKVKVEFDEFDDKILVEWLEGLLPSPLYLHYYQLNKKQRFKVKDYDSAFTIKIENKDYLFSNYYGLYLIK